MTEEPEYESQFTTEIHVWKLLEVALYFLKIISWIFNDFHNSAATKSLDKLRYLVF